MTEQEKRIISKLKAIINNTPYDGEKKTALNVLKNYCLKHSISESELDVTEEKTFTYELIDKSGQSLSLFCCVGFKVLKRHKKNFNNCSDFFHKRNNHALHYIKVSCTASEFLEIVGEFEVYNREFKKQLTSYLRDKRTEFARAFIHAHDLLIDRELVEPKRIGEERIEDEIDRFWESAAYFQTLKTVKHVNVYKQIADKG